MVASPIDIYRREIEKKLQAGNATEHTHRSAMETLIESHAPALTATHEPKRVECGAPDFVISRKAAHGHVTVGYIEAKDVGQPLDESARSEQMKRYLLALPNLVLTDYLEFRWYVNSERRLIARLAHVGKGYKLIPEEGGAKAVSNLLAAFLSHEAQPIDSPKELALRTARLTHFIRDMIVTAFEQDSASATLGDWRNAFEKALIPNLPIAQFADMFAPTLAYGLCAARVNHRGPPGSFRRLGAAAEIPKTNRFLRRLFEAITGADLDDESFAGFVDDLAQLLADTEMGAVLADFGKRSARQDPVVRFYETFLAAYDPKLGEARGVYYTPEPVISYIVRSVDYLLKTRFGCPDGLADTATVEYRSAAVPAAVAPASGRQGSQRDPGVAAASSQQDAGATVFGPKTFSITSTRCSTLQPTVRATWNFSKAISRACRSLRTGISSTCLARRDGVGGMPFARIAQTGKSDGALPREGLESCGEGISKVRCSRRAGAGYREAGQTRSGIH